MWTKDIMGQLNPSLYQQHYDHVGHKYRVRDVFELKSKHIT